MAKTFTKTCKECGASFESSKVEAKFCAQACRLAFNNRRRDRGAMLYDVLMNCRYDRDAAAQVFGTNDLRKLMSEMAAGWAAQDAVAKKGKTWQGPRATKEAMGTLRSIRVSAI